MCGAGLLRGTLKEGAFLSTGPGLPSHDAQAQREKGYVVVGHIAVAVAVKMGGSVNAKEAGLLLQKEEVLDSPAATQEAPAEAAAPPQAAAQDDDEDAPSAAAKKVRCCRQCLFSSSHAPPPSPLSPKYKHNSPIAEKEEGEAGGCGGGGLKSSVIYHFH